MRDNVETSVKPKANIFRSSRWQEDHSRKPKHKVLVPPTNVLTPVNTPAKLGLPDVERPYEDTLKEKYDRVLATFREAGLLAETAVINVKPSPRALGYRCHAKLAVRPASEALFAPAERRFAIGLFQPDSHVVVHREECPTHKESINALVVDLMEELEASKIEPYSETSLAGDLRYVAIRAAHRTEEVMLTLVMTSDKFRVELKAMVLRLRQKGHIIVSAQINVNDESTNTIFGPTTKKLVGTEGLRESVCGLTFEIGPTSFFQINPWQAEAIYRRVESLAGSASSGQVAWDLYCGTGQISMLLAGLGYRTLGIEENPKAIDDAIANVSRNRLEMRPEYIAARVEDLVGRLPTWSDDPQVIVANPSRRGLAPAARALIEEGLQSRPETRLVYVSCEAETLIRDLKELTVGGRRLRQLECFDMFPYTDKLEWIAVVQ